MHEVTFQNKQPSIGQHGELNLMGNQHWKDFHPHKKFLIVWIPIEITGFGPQHFTKQLYITAPLMFSSCKYKTNLVL